MLYGLIDILAWMFMVAALIFAVYVVIFLICCVIADIREDKTKAICDELEKIREACEKSNDKE